MTEAEKWAHNMRLRSAAYNGLESNVTILKMIQGLDADFPNQCFNLVDNKGTAPPGGAVIGVRRVFRDKSYADMLHRHQATGKIEFGMLSAGLLGTARNGRVMLH